jgi:hypothetical protein
VAQAEKRKGEGRDFTGLFIGTVNLKNKLGFRSREAISTVEGADVRGEKSWPNEGDDRWARVVSIGGKRGSYRFGSVLSWAVGQK